MDMDFSEIIPALPALWEGMVMTLQLMVMGVVGGIVLGTILALMRLSSSKLLSNVAGAYVNYFRSIPLLLVITWFYLAVPFVLRWITGEDTPVGAFTSCVVAFMMFEAAYFCEIVRAGVQSISKGQMGAAQALGMTYGQTMRLIILPQAFRKMTRCCCSRASSCSRTPRWYTPWAWWTSSTRHAPTATSSGAP